MKGTTPGRTHVHLQFLRVPSEIRAVSGEVEKRSKELFSTSSIAELRATGRDVEDASEQVLSLMDRGVDLQEQAG